MRKIETPSFCLLLVSSLTWRESRQMQPQRLRHEKSCVIAQVGRGERSHADFHDAVVVFAGADVEQPEARVAAEAEHLAQVQLTQRLEHGDKPRRVVPVGDSGRKHAQVAAHIDHRRPRPNEPMYATRGGDRRAQPVVRGCAKESVPRGAEGDVRRGGGCCCHSSRGVEE